MFALAALPADANAAPPAVVEAVSPATEANALGVSVTWIGGSGLTYRHWFENNVGVQVAGIPWVTADLPGTNGAITEGTSFLNFGGQVMWRFLHQSDMQIYALGAIGYGFQKNTIFYNGKNSPKQHMDLGVAPGLGIDKKIAPNVWLNGELSYTFGFQTNDSVSSSNFIPGIGAGVFYYW